jgi:hypothetical protein
MDLLARSTSFDASRGIPSTAFPDVTGMNQRIDSLVSNHQIIVG